MSLVFAVEVKGERVAFKSNPTDLFPTAESALKAKNASKDESVKSGAIVAYRLSKTVVLS